jgi:uncharacterized protein YukE
MARIRVDTEELRRSAKDIASAADSIGKAGDEILAVAMALPSYDGQLSGPARKAGYDIQTQMRDLKTCLAGDAETVNKAAQAYEEVDGQTVTSLDKLFSALAECASSAVNGLLGSITTSISNILGVTPDACSNLLYSYSRDPLTGIVIIYNKQTGETLIFTAEDLQNPAIAANVESFKDYINSTNAAVIAEAAAAMALVIGLAAGGIGIVLASSGLPAVAAWGVAAIGVIGGIAVAIINAPSLLNSIQGSANMWEALKIQYEGSIRSP